jgi:hypothetical protein
VKRVSAAVATLALSSASVASCSEPPPAPPFQLMFLVESDPGKPMVGATLSRSGVVVATTDVTGHAPVTVKGVEGELTDVTVACPEGFQSPTKPIRVRLTRLVEKGKLPEYRERCPPTVRRVVVAVRAENGPGLPVMYLNKAVTRTNQDGVAHFALEVAPRTSFQVVLDTSERRDLKPQSPPKVFVVGETDDILLFDQKFEVERPRVFGAAKPNIPRALN